MLVVLVGLEHQVFLVQQDRLHHLTILLVLVVVQQEDLVLQYHLL